MVHDAVTRRRARAAGPTEGRIRGAALDLDDHPRAAVAGPHRPGPAQPPWAPLAALHLPPGIRRPPRAW